MAQVKNELSGSKKSEKIYIITEMNSEGEMIQWRKFHRTLDEAKAEIQDTRFERYAEYLEDEGEGQILPGLKKYQLKYDGTYDQDEWTAQEYDRIQYCVGSEFYIITELHS